MTILVTGGCGYIGSLLIRELPKAYPGETIRILDNMSKERYVSLWNLPEGIKYELIEGDIKDPEMRIKALKDVNVVFHLAAITNAPKTFDCKELTYEVNHKAATELFKDAIKAGVKKLVYASTASVYGPTNGKVTEDYDCKPKSPYAEAKLSAEQDLLKLSKEHDFNGTALRLGTVYGWTIGMRFDTVVDRFCYLASIGQPLTVYESAIKEKRPYCHVKDIVRAMIFAAQNEKTKGDVFNVVSSNASIGEVTDYIKELLPDVEITITETPSLNQLSYELIGDKFTNLGFEFKHDMKEGVKEMIEEFKALHGENK